ncbi:MAG: hypothetical protein LBV67_09440, partial [Streptococcaceae bacterium]|nr:hypothetical protein [Streptococcaceae bacterium]
MKLYFDNKIRKIGVALMMTAMLSNVLTPSLSVVAMDIQQETTQEEMVDNESTISENVSDNNELQEADDGTITTDSSNVTDKVDDSVDKVVDSSENLDKNIETSQLDVSKASPEKETVETRNSDYTLSAHGMTLHVNELATLSTADIAQKILTDSEATIKEVNNNPIPSDMQLFVNGIESLTPVAEKQEVVISSNNSDLPEITIPVFVSDDDTGIMDTRYMGWDKIVVLYMKDFEIKHSEYFDWHKLNIGSYELNYFDDLITAYDIQTGEQLFRDFFQSTLSLLMPSDTVPEDIQGDFHTRLAWWVQSERMPHSNLTIIDDTYKIDVANGTRTDSEKNPNVESTVFSIKADPAPEGQVFDKWVSDNGGTFADETSSETTFTMPANDVSLTATYKVAESSLTFAIYENFYGTRLGKLTNLNVIAQKPYGSDSYITDTTINPDGTVTVTGAFEVGDFIQIGMGNP